MTASDLISGLVESGKATTARYWRELRVLLGADVAELRHEERRAATNRLRLLVRELGLSHDELLRLAGVVRRDAELGAALEGADAVRAAALAARADVAAYNEESDRIRVERLSRARELEAVVDEAEHKLRAVEDVSRRREELRASAPLLFAHGESDDGAIVRHLVESPVGNEVGDVATWTLGHVLNDARSRDWLATGRVRVEPTSRQSARHVAELVELVKRVHGVAGGKPGRFLLPVGADRPSGGLVDFIDERGNVEGLAAADYISPGGFAGRCYVTAPGQSDDELAELVLRLVRNAKRIARRAARRVDPGEPETGVIAANYRELAASPPAVVFRDAARSLAPVEPAPEADVEAVAV